MSFIETGRSRRKVLMMLVASIVLLTSMFGPVQRRLTATLLLRGETLNESAFSDLLERSPDVSVLLERAWNSGKIPHRRAAITSLNNVSPAELAKFEPVLERAAVDCDSSVRELALSQLARLKSTTLPGLARVQLADADPDLRMLGLRAVRNESASSAVPAVAPLLSDRDAQVASLAAGALRRWTGEDFGVRASEVLSAERRELEHFADAIDHWKNWWTQHKRDFPATNTAPAVFERDTLRTSDWQLQALGGSTVRLSDFRGKTVLLNFWTTWCTACVGEFDTLNKLQQAHANDLVVLGISLDGVPDEHGHVTGSEHNSEHSAASHISTEKIAQQVARVASARGLKYRVCLDPQNTVGSRFNGGELPTNVLINSRGEIVRRFVGPRSLDVLEQMVAEGVD